MEPLLEVTNLSKSFSVSATAFGGPKRRLQAVAGVSFALYRGETLGLVGESGCGKSTIGKLILRLLEPDSGEIRFAGQVLQTLSQRQMRPLRRELQMIFQDPFSSLNPRMRIGQILSEPLQIHRLGNGHLRTQVVDCLRTVGLDEEHYDRFPHEFSGGQRQRIGIARALITRPQLIIADEPVSALDISIQAQIINLLCDLQRRLKLTYLFIGHDLAVVRHVSDRIAVMYFGKIVELAATEALYTHPLHPYSEALLNAAPIPDPRQRGKRRILGGEIPSPVDPPSGCALSPRCPYARPLCVQVAPELEEVMPGRWTACHYSTEVGRFRRQDPTAPAD
ncbi:MAG: ATP-binding cassette domain-containing protein [Desulfuromonadaceae bacterium]|nr:ATP-binding cassette domain-containing protein [Desulfuromonadaceae bacterium]